mgnify:CR=1 FL=1
MVNHLKRNIFNLDLSGAIEAALCIRLVHISHNAPYLPTKILHNLCFSFLRGIKAVPREIESKGYANFGGAKKVHYGECGSGEYCYLLN